MNIMHVVGGRQGLRHAQQCGCVPAPRLRAPCVVARPAYVRFRPGHAIIGPPAPCRASAQAAAAAGTAAVDFTVGPCTYSMSSRAGSSGVLLRLAEQSEDAEYVLLVPQAVAGILLEVLQRAAACLLTGNDGRPLELHHHFTSGQRVFSCSLTFDPSSSSSTAAVSAASAVEGAAAAVVSVTEKGRSAVQLRLSEHALPDVQRMLQLLEQMTAAGVAGDSGSLDSAAAAGAGPAAAAAAAAATSLAAGPVNGGPHRNGNGARGEGFPREVQSSLQQAAAVDSPPAATAAAARSEAVASEAPASWQPAAQQQQLQDTAGAKAGSSTGVTAPAADSQSERPSEPPPQPQQPATPQGYHSSNGTSSRQASAGVSGKQVAAAAAAPPYAASAAAAPTRPGSTAAAAGTATADVAPAGDAAAAAAAAAAGDGPSVEGLLAAIMSSTTFTDGMAFAHSLAATITAGSSAAAPDNSSSSASSGSSAASSGSPYGVHLVALWSQMPAYAARCHLQLLGLSPADEDASDVSVDDVAAGSLQPEAQQQMQEFADVLLPLLEQQLAHIPASMLQLLLATADRVALQLPPAFLQAWAAAAAGGGFGSWSSKQLAEATQQLMNQQQPASGLMMPLAWSVPLLLEVARRAELLLRQLSVGSSESPAAAASTATAEEETAAAAGDELMLLAELVAVLLAAAGADLEHQAALWQPPSDSQQQPAAATAAAAAAAGNEAGRWLPDLYAAITHLLVPTAAQDQSAAAIAAGAERLQLLLELQGVMCEAVVQLPGSQRHAATQLLWSWLVAGQGAVQLPSSNLLQILQLLPYNTAAAAYAAAVAGWAKGSAAAACSHGSLLAAVLQTHSAGAVTTSSSSSSSQQKQQMYQDVAAVPGLLSVALQQEPTAAFQALPALLALLPPVPAAAADECAVAAEASVVCGDMDAVLMQLCQQLLRLLELDAEQLLSHGSVISRTLSASAAASGASGQGLLAVLQLVLQLGEAATSWQQLQLPPLPHQGGWGGGSSGGSSSAGASVAAQIAGSCLATAPAWVERHLGQGQQQQQQLSWYAEVLPIAAELRELAAGHDSLAPAWLPLASSSSSSSMGAPAAAEAAATRTAGGGCTFVDGCLWARVESSVLAAAAAAAASDSPMAADDVIAVVSALTWLGLQPSPQLLGSYLEAVGSDPLGLTAEGLCHLLWILAGELASSSSSSRGQLLQLASKACSSLAVKPAGSVSPRHLARTTWAVAALADAARDSTGSSVWRPPQQLVAWLQWSWEATAGGSWSSSSSAAVGQYSGNRQELATSLQQLVLQPGEVQHLLGSLQQLGLLQSDTQPSEQHQHQQPPAAVDTFSSSSSRRDGAPAPTASGRSIDAELDNAAAPAAAAAAATAAVSTTSGAAAAEPAAAASHVAAQPSTTVAVAAQHMPLQLQQAELLRQVQLTITSLESGEPVAAGALLAAAHAAVAAAASMQDVVPLLQLLTAVAAAAGEAAGGMLREAGPALLQQVMPVLTPQQLQVLSDEQREQLAQDLNRLSRKNARNSKKGGSKSGGSSRRATASKDSSTNTSSSAGSNGDAHPSAAVAADHPVAPGALESSVAATPAAAESIVAATPPAAESGVADAPAAAAKSSSSAAPAAAESSVAATPAAAAETSSAAAPAAAESSVAAAPAAAESSSSAAPAAESWAAAPAVASADSAAGVAGETQPLPAAATASVSIEEVVQQLNQQQQSQGPRLTQKQALQLLVPAQSAALQLAGQELLLFTQACLEHRVPLAPPLLLAAAKAAAAAPELQPGLALQLAAAAAAAATAPVDKAAGKAATGGSDAAGSETRQVLLQQVVPRLSQHQLSLLRPEQLLQLLKDVRVLAGSPGATTSSTGLPSLDTPTVGAAPAAAAAAVDVAWLSGVAAALDPKLLLMPFGGNLLQALQLLQALGLPQPGSSFMGRFFAAADALLDTFSARNCLDLLAAATVAGQMPSKQLTTALLQHMAGARLAPEHAAAGMRLLASLRLRPGLELQQQWFETTEAAADQLPPHLVLQMLWACCTWRLQPPSQWLHAVVKGLLPPGRLSASSPATVAGICLSLWQLGVEPSSGFAAAVMAAAQHSINSQLQQEQAAGGSSTGWQRFEGSQQQQQQQQQQQERPPPAWDAESLSVVCFCLLMWNAPITPAWKAAVAARAAAVLPQADGPSLLRLGVYLTQAFQVSHEAEQELPWQHALFDAATLLLSQPPAAAAAASGDASSNAELVIEQGASGGYSYSRPGFGSIRGIPAHGLALLFLAVLEPQPFASLPLLRRLVAAVATAAAAGRGGGLATWDLLVTLPAFSEVQTMLLESEGDSEEGGSGLDPMQRLLLLQEVKFLELQAQQVIRTACQGAGRASSAVIEQVPVLAGQALNLQLPREVLDGLQADLAAAQEREAALREALALLEAGGGAALPDSLLEGLEEVAACDGLQALAEYLDNPSLAAFLRRLRLVGADTSEAFVLRGMAA